MGVSHSNRRQRMLGEHAQEMETLIRGTINKLIVESPQEADTMAPTSSATKDIRSKWRRMKWFMFGHHQDVEYDPNDLRLKQPIHRKQFQTWLETTELCQLLEDVQIDVSSKYEIFDVLDMDMYFKLDIDELVGGMMRLRGGI